MKVNAHFLKSAAATEQFPVLQAPEVAFLGRSNVGKSSLINALLGQKLAHVSSTPGRTRTINFIAVHMKPQQAQPELLFVDLPGYGFARIAREVSAKWPQFIEPYLEQREMLKLCVCLVDANVPPQRGDHLLIHWLQHHHRNLVVVATKADRLSVNQQKKSLAQLSREHNVERILPCSAKTGAGIAELWQEIRAAVTSSRHGS